MSNKENKKIAIDAWPSSSVNGVVATTNPSPNELEIYNGYNNNNNAVINNNMLVNHQSNSATNLIFENSRNISIGNTINVGWNPVVANNAGSLVRANQNTQIEESFIYRKKTPTISEMMKSKQPLNEKYLDMFCDNFGSRYRSVAVLLNVSDLFFQRMYEDHFQRGTGEVIYQVLYHHFQQNQDIATVGWFTTFLWDNGFRQTVWEVKEYYKKLKKMDEDDD
ncbi:hypothetical protein PVAND_011322 [Polypedilum vanderplanki]|uniref:Uncharacterized protein n=1 Tax=Polypedilum vanderplanki TaxID=319348 RepID=A0A9J6CK12_POLVA|nr:hypothetical protein PVAND_011322 [Polypedilum vanderplanki]